MRLLVFWVILLNVWVSLVSLLFCLGIVVIVWVFKLLFVKFFVVFFNCFSGVIRCWYSIKFNRFNIIRGNVIWSVKCVVSNNEFGCICCGSWIKKCVLLLMKGIFIIGFLEKYKCIFYLGLWFIWNWLINLFNIWVLVNVVIWELIMVSYVFFFVFIFCKKVVNVCFLFFR